jgi:hypothetical protein
MAITLDGTSGITTPDVNSDGLTVDTTTLVVDEANNRVGIGTSSPSYRFHLVQPSSDNALVIDNGGGAGDNTNPYLAFSGTSAGSNYIRGRIRGTLPNSTDGGLAFDTGSSGSMSERARIDSSGNLGIGTSSPATGVRLQVSGGKVRIDHNTALEWGGTAYSIVGNATTGYLQFNTASTERARIDSSGSLRLGTTLDFGVTNKLTISYAGGGVQYGIVMRPGTDNTVPLYFQNAAGTQIGSISTSASSTAYNTSSDYRLKENVVGVTGAAARVQQLNPVRFNFIADPDRTVDGFLAHEVQDVVPEAITGTKDATEMVDVHDEDGNVTGQEERPVYQGIDQSKLVPLLTAALQEALGKIETLEARVAALEAA